MKCSKCGVELENGALFCASCGAKVEPEAATEAASAANSAPAPAPQPSFTTQPITIVNNTNQSDGAPVSLGGWICRSLIPLIPCVGGIIYIVMLFIWAFDTKYDSTSRNWAKSVLILALAGIVLGIIAAVVAVSLGVIPAVLNNITGYNSYHY